jgi:hypothetical protein
MTSFLVGIECIAEFWGESHYFKLCDFINIFYIALSVSGHENRHNRTGNPTITNGNSTEPAGMSGVAALPSRYSKRIFFKSQQKEERT